MLSFHYCPVNLLRFFANAQNDNMFDKAVENRNAFVNDKCLVFRGGLGYLAKPSPPQYGSTPCHSDRREESININRTQMLSFVIYSLFLTYLTPIIHSINLGHPTATRSHSLFCYPKLSSTMLG